MRNLRTAIKDPIFLSAMFSLLFFILKNYGLLEMIGLNANSYQELTGLITTILVVLGITHKTGTKQINLKK